MRKPHQNKLQQKSLWKTEYSLKIAVESWWEGISRKTQPYCFPVCYKSHLEYLEEKERTRPKWFYDWVILRNTLKLCQKSYFGFICAVLARSKCMVEFLTSSYGQRSRKSSFGKHLTRNVQRNRGRCFWLWYFHSFLCLLSCALIYLYIWTRNRTQVFWCLFFLWGLLCLLGFFSFPWSYPCQPFSTASLQDNNLCFYSNLHIFFK